MKINQEYGKILLRVSLSLVFLWFGINQLYNPANWTGFVPTSISSIVPANTLVLLNGSVEVLLGMIMLFGFFTRTSALILGVHLMGISLSLGFSAIAIRDYGLALATLSIIFFGPDKWCFGSDKQLYKSHSP